MSTHRGFTLIELMVVVAIVAIIAAIAIPSYNEQVRKSRRADAVSEIGRLQLDQERRRAEGPTYLAVASTNLPSGHYSIAVATPASGTCAGAVATTTANSYAITATAIGAQASDTKCATIVLTSRCGVIAKTSTGGGVCW